jgi:hypothetical protein
MDRLNDDDEEKFLWYQKLWGEINDKIFQDYKADSKVQLIPFNEEDLLI